MCLAVFLAVPDAELRSPFLTWVNGSTYCTVRVKLAVCETDPAVAVMVTE
jgi:hypothetical protein